jgi:hypothetical protein
VRRAQLQTLERLTELQRAALRCAEARGPRKAVNPGDDRPHIHAAARLSAEYDFELIGCGSTRLAVDASAVAPGTVAKIAFEPHGLVFNLSEAALWLVFPDELRQHLAPVVQLAPSLVAFQERLKPVSPTLIDVEQNPAKAQRAFARSFDKYGDQVAAIQVALGQGVPPNRRMDNHGIRRDGRLVICDYGERFEPFEAIWAWVLDRLQAGPLLTDDTERALFEETIMTSLGGFSVRWRPSLLWLIERAGLRPRAAVYPCPCGRSRPARECLADSCGLWRDAASWQLEESQKYRARPGGALAAALAS